MSRTRFRGFVPLRAQPQPKQLPRGLYKGIRVDGPVAEKDHFFKCSKCGEPIDKRDLGIVLTHDGPLPHPKEKGPENYSRDEVEELVGAYAITAAPTKARITAAVPKECWAIKLQTVCTADNIHIFGGFSPRVGLRMILAGELRSS